MPKRRITHRQADRIANIQKRRQAKAQEKSEKALADLQTSELGPEQTGLVVAHFGTMADIEDEQGQVHRCLLRQHLGVLVAGDIVTWQSAPTGGVITARHDRRSALGRPDAHGQIKPIAANIDQMLIVTAPEPRLVTLLLDSYLVAAHALHIDAVIVLNKIDLLSDEAESEIEQQISVYRTLGYTVLDVSTKAKDGLDACAKIMKEKTSVLVGQSGVGKSSIISALLPNEDIRTAALSEQSKLGSHTTTTARLYHLDCGGNLIDSPGIREFKLWALAQEDIERGFIEFEPYLGHCKFRNCAHESEPGCAILEAVQQQKIHPARLENFQKLLLSHLLQQ